MTGRRLEKTHPAITAEQLLPGGWGPRKPVDEVKPEKVNLPPAWAMKAARAIIVAGEDRVEHWVRVFTNGDAAVPKPTPFQPFNLPIPKTTTPEEANELNERNVINLAWAIKAYEQLDKTRSV